MVNTFTEALAYLNWDDLRFFLALYRHGSFVSTAVELNTTHPRVARKITNLEASLQSQLFQRSAKGCSLTPTGEMLLPYAEQVESTFIQLREVVSGKNSQLIGGIRIGVPNGFGNIFLASRLIKFQSLHPELEIELLASPKNYSLSKREVDILISLNKPHAGNIIARKLINYKLGLFATEKYLQGKNEIRKCEDLRGHRIVSFIEDLVFDQDMKFWEEIAPGLTTHFRSSTVITQMYALMADGGIGVLPYFMANIFDNLIPVLPDRNIERAFWLQVNPDSRELARVRTTIDFIVTQIEESSDLFLSLST
ncbi:MAG: LysR family transcriptional regulator [Desulforhopalus sp.]